MIKKYNQNKLKSQMNPVDLYVGTRLKIRRSEMGLSQNAIGEMVGITFQQIQKYEKGANRIGSSRLYEFGKILKVPVSYFFEQYEETVSGMGEILSPEGFILESKDVSEREIVSLVKNFSRIRNKNFRKSILATIKNAVNDDDK